jgi:ribonuclease D
MTANSAAVAGRQLPPLTLITGPRALQRMLERIRHEPSVAFDTESNSLHAYHERVCLIQISVPGADYIIDPLAEQFARMMAPQLAPLGALFADRRVQKIFHAAEYDLIGLKRDFGFEVHNIFDTMQAARILGLQQVGLGTLLEQYFGVTLDKRLQRADWGKRPLSPDLLSYARLDTQYLIDLRDLLRAQLIAAGRLQEAEEHFERATLVETPDRPFDPDGFWRLHKANELTGRQLAIVRELFLYREQQAERLDRPPFKVMGDQSLIALAQQAPRDSDGLHAAGLSPRQIQRFGHGVLTAIEHGRQAPLPTPPAARVRPDDAVLARYDALRNWRKARAKQRGVDSDVILSRDALWALAHKPPRALADLESVESVGAWQRQQYGAEIVELLLRLK